MGFRCVLFRSIVGSGLGGLARGIRLQSAGVETVIGEARDKPGGHAYSWEQGGFTFDAGPTVISYPDGLRELWALSGRDMADDVTLVPVSPFYRLHWIDGTHFEYSNDDAQLTGENGHIDTGAAAGHLRFLCYLPAAYEEGSGKHGRVERKGVACGKGGHDRVKH